MPKTKPVKPVDQPAPEVVEQPAAETLNLPELDDDESIELVEVEYQGEMFTVPKDIDDWNTADLETIYRAPDVFSVVRASIGEDQYRNFITKFPKHRDFKAFSEHLGKVMRSECVGF